jgi:ferredoxin
MRVRVDPDLCSGHGRCYVLASEVFHADDDGFCAERGRTIEISDELARTARGAVASCPEAAIRIVED